MALRQTIGTTAAVAVLCSLGSSASAAETSTTLPSATVVLSTNRAGARPVAITVRLRYEMQCGWAGPGPLTIRLPAAMSLPTTIPPTEVVIDGKPAKRIGVSGKRIVLGLPPRPPILCDAIAPGTLKIAFTRAAHLGNPKASGTYQLRATEGSSDFLATLTIRSR